MRALTLLLLVSVCGFAEKVPVEKLIEMAKSHAPGLDQALRDTLGADAIQKGTAVDGVGKDFVWAVAGPTVMNNTTAGPKLQIDYEEPVASFRAGSLYVYTGEVK